MARRSLIGKISQTNLPLRSEIRLDTFTAYGSTDTRIPQFTTSSTTGTALTLTTNNATNGASITVNENGIYSATFTINGASGGRAVAAITKNETSPGDTTTNATALSNTLRLQIDFDPIVAANDSNAFCTWTGILSQGDIIRPHTDAGTPATAALSIFTICKVSE